MQGIISSRTLFALGIALALVPMLFLSYAAFAAVKSSVPAPTSSGEGGQVSGGEQTKLPAFFAAAIAITVSCLSAGAAIYGVATSGFAASAEKPELRTFMLILGGLAEGIAIYGLLVAIMILGKV